MRVSEQQEPATVSDRCRSCLLALHKLAGGETGGANPPPPSVGPRCFACSRFCADPSRFCCRIQGSGCLDNPVGFLTST